MEVYKRADILYLAGNEVGAAMLKDEVGGLPVEITVADHVEGLAAFFGHSEVCIRPYALAAQPTKTQDKKGILQIAYKGDIRSAKFVPTDVEDLTIIVESHGTRFNISDILLTQVDGGANQYH